MAGIDDRIELVRSTLDCVQRARQLYMKIITDQPMTTDPIYHTLYSASLQLTRQLDIFGIDNHNTIRQGESRP